MPKSRIIVLMGAPGSGKGTQGHLIHKKYGWPQISTGDILRSIAKEPTDLGRQVAEIQQRGDLVSDAVLADVVRARTKDGDCADGYILDGFPRTLVQGKMLEDLAKEQGREILPLYVRVMRDELMRRLTGRRTCPMCHKIYNLYTMAPKFDTLCDNHETPVQLTHRSDDNETSVAHRLEVYSEMTKPLYEYYRSTDRLIVIDGALSVDEVFRSICAVVEA